MTNSIIFNNNLKHVMSSFVFLAVLLTSANVLAATRVTPVYGTMPANCVNIQTTTVQAADPDKTVTHKTSICKGSRNSKPANTRRVFSDDYERTLRAVTQPQKRKVLWIGK